MTRLTKEETIRHYEESLEEICFLLNDALVAIAGAEAEWEPGPPYSGIDLGKTYSVTGELLAKIAAARESANSVLAWVDDVEISNA
ncbi:MAG: hypothetical protein HC771_21995 [Synechococcales cyanobacterium CRU_2_2]|nr:hypothetical protein [Synechococcales cyanobacterium CRU_2_2]